MEKIKKIIKGRFIKGKSGNPKGRPKGLRDKRLIYRDLIREHSKEIIDKAIRMSTKGKGNSRMICFLLPYILPDPHKDISLPLNINFSSITGYKERCQLLDESLDEGKISLNAYKIISEIMLRRFEGLQINERLTKIEEAYEARIFKTD